MNVDDAARHAVRALREQAVRIPEVETLVLRGRRQRVRKYWAISLAVAAVVVAVAVPIVLVASADRSPQARIIVGGSIPAAGVTTGQIQAGWTRLPNAVAYQTFVHQAAAGPAGFVAVGYSCVPGCSGSQPTIPAIWYSSDAARWTRVSAEAIPSSGTSVDAVTYWHDEFWAISQGDAGAPVWTSSDGRVWKAQPSPTLALRLSPKETPYQLVADQLGLFAYTSGGVAFSPDGRTWTTTDLPREVSAITRIGSHLVALVDVPVAPGSGRAVVFTSGDGLHWSRGPDLGASVDPGSITVTTWHHELWAVSYPSSADNASLIWHSPDGISWSHPEVSYSPPGTVFDQLIPIGPYLVATGFDTNSRPGGWVTTDGSHWIPMPDLGRPPGGRLDIAASYGRALVAMSSSGLDDFYRWTVPTPPTSVSTSSVASPLLRLPADLASEVCAAAATGKATSIEYVATTERRETQALNTEDGNANTPVWVIEMRGSFDVTRGLPLPGGTDPHGTVATATYDRRTHAVIGDGIVNQYHDLHTLGPVGTLTC